MQLVLVRVRVSSGDVAAAELHRALRAWATPEDRLEHAYVGRVDDGWALGLWIDAPIHEPAEQRCEELVCRVIDGLTGSRRPPDVGRTAPSREPR